MVILAASSSSTAHRTLSRNGGGAGWLSIFTHCLDLPSHLRRPHDEHDVLVLLRLRAGVNAGVARPLFVLGASPMPAAWPKVCRPADLSGRRERGGTSPSVGCYFALPTRAALTRGHHLARRCSLPRPAACPRKPCRSGLALC